MGKYSRNPVARKPGLAAATAVLCLAGSTAAQAFIIDVDPLNTQQGNPPQDVYKVTISDPVANDPGDTTFTVNWLLPADPQFAPVDLSATAEFTVLSFTDSTLQLGIDITNTTDLTLFPNDNNAVLAFGFNVDPDISSVAVDDDGTLPWQADTAQNFPTFQSISVCAWPDANNNCSGGNVNNGLQAGASDSLILTLTTGTTFASTNPELERSVMLTDLPLKFQGSWGSYELPGNPNGGGGNGHGNGNDVPEPAPLLLVTLGMAIAGLRRMPLRSR